MPTPLTYPWQRRWLPITPAADQLAPPYEADSTGYVNLQTWSFGPEKGWLGLTLDELTDKHRCVVLLGEPGIGKSQEWRTQQEKLGGQARHLLLDLGSINSEEVLRREILESEQVIGWRADDSVLTLWLDSLDEGLLHVNTLQQALLRVLRAPLPLDRLCLRILCRNAVWPLGFTEALTRQLRLPDPHDEALLTLVLSPLSREQVAQAAIAEGFEAEQFLVAVAAADSQPLASRPVTLKLLLQLYQVHQATFGLTENAGRAGIYERGCLELCERPDRDRPEGHRPDPHQRLLLAGYVAMLSVFTNRRVLAAEPLPGVVGPAELDVYALSGGTTAQWKGIRADITVPALRDLFRSTGLFTDTGQERLVWAHQSYAEFLAAWYIQLTDLPVNSLRALFRSSADPTGGIVPALQETAAWLADMRPEFWETMLALDPVPLLQSDLRRLPAMRRAQIVERLIQWLAGLAYPPYQSLAFLEHLAHPGLAQQLAPLLADPTTPGALARFATDLAKMAKVDGLQPLLLAQALDASWPLALRNRALYILYDIADETTLNALRPLRHLIPHDDASDELRGHLLHLLWPSQLQVEELLPLITQRKDQRLYGAYHRFLDDLNEGQLALTRESLLASLRWVTQHVAKWRGSEESFWQRTALYLQQKAWKLVDDPEVAATLAKAIVAAEEAYHPFSVEGTAAQRMMMLTRLLPHYRKLHYHRFADNAFGPNKDPALIQVEDWPAVYALLDTWLTYSARKWVAKILTQLLHNLLNAGSPDYTARYEELYRAAAQFPSVREVFAPWCASIDLEEGRKEQNSEWRQQSKVRERKEARERRYWRNINLRRIVKMWLAIRSVLQKGNTATLYDWKKLVENITTAQVKNGFSVLYDIGAAPRWVCLTSLQKEQVTDIAQAMLETYPRLPPEWWQAGYGAAKGATLLHQALLLLQHHRPAYLDALSIPFWESWSDFLVSYQTSGHDHLVVDALLHRAITAVPVLVEEAIYRIAEAHGKREGPGMSSFTNFYRALPGAIFPVQMLAAIQNSKWYDEPSAYLLVQMLKVGYEPAWEYAAEMLAEPGTGKVVVDCARPGLVVPVYQWLLFDRERQQQDPWPWWLRLSTQPVIAQRVLNAAVYHVNARELRHLSLLDEQQLETLILWLTQAFALVPNDVDDWENRPKGRLGAVRTAAALELAARGTLVAWEILQKLADYMGQPFWLHARVDQVRENLRRNAWEPLPPIALATLSREANRRWVRSAVDLQDLVLESLARFQVDLHGEPTTAQFLWIPLKDSAHRSRITGYEVHDENYFSNVVRQHLRQDLERSNILVKREVEIRPAMGADTGQRTDIFIEAFTRSPIGEKLDIVVVVIEVKLSRHPKVESALKAQLADYLTDQKYKHGIYLVGWHYGQHDPKPSNKLDLPALTLLLTQQAAATAPDYTIKSCVLDIRLPADTARA